MFLSAARVRFLSGLHDAGELKFGAFLLVRFIERFRSLRRECDDSWMLLVRLRQRYPLCTSI